MDDGERGSLRCKKRNPITKASTDWGDVTLKFFKADGTELIQDTGAGETDGAFQARLDADCVFTQVDFEPPHDMEVIGGAIMAVGHFLMAFEPAFYVALATIAIGNGLFLPSLPSQIGALYREDDPRRTFAYNFY